MQLLSWTLIYMRLRDALLPARRILQIRQGALPPAVTRLLVKLRDLLEADGRHELGRVPRVRHLGIQLVDLLQAQAFRLVDERVDEEGADEAKGAPDEEDLAAEIGVAGPRVDEVRGRVCNGPVEQPVGRRGHGEAARACLEREDLARHHPGDGAPGRGEEEDVEADEGDQDLVGHHARVRRARDGDDELADEHADGAPEE